MNRQTKQDVFQRGRRAGMWLSHKLIFPIPIALLNKDSSGWVGRLAGIPNYRNKSVEQVKDELRHRVVGQESTMFLLKPTRDKQHVEVSIF